MIANARIPLTGNSPAGILIFLLAGALFSTNAVLMTWNGSNLSPLTYSAYANAGVTVAISIAALFGALLLVAAGSAVARSETRNRVSHNPQPE